MELLSEIGYCRQSVLRGIRVIEIIYKLFIETVEYLVIGFPARHELKDTQRRQAVTG